MSEETESTVGDLVQRQKIDVLKTLCYVVGAAVYVAGVVYAEAHGFSMLSKGVAPEFMIWASAGMIAVGITAVILPIMLAKVIKDQLQWIVVLLFYVLDVGIMAINAAIDFMGNSAGQLPEWGLMYAQWILPLTPVIVAGGWIVDFLLDPDIRKRIKLAAVESAIDNKRLTQTIKHASTSDASALIDGQAAIDSGQLIAMALGKPVYREMARQAGSGLVIPGVAHPSEAAAGFGMGAYDPQPWAHVTPAAPPTPARRSIFRARPGNGKKSATAEAPDLAKLLASLQALGVDPNALAALLAKQSPPTVGYALDIDGLKAGQDDRPNVDLERVRGQQ